MIENTEHRLQISKFFIHDENKNLEKEFERLSTFVEQYCLKFVKRRFYWTKILIISEIFSSKYKICE